MTQLIYQFFLGILALIALPKMLYLRFLYGKYKNSLSKRFGRDFPQIDKGDRFLVWIHAVSVGEARAVGPLVKLMKRDFPNCLIVFSSITETGHTEAKRAIPQADYHVYLPFDFSWIIGPVIDRTRPDLLLFSETDFWYNFMSDAKRRGAKIAAVNGKLSARSLKRFLLAPWFSSQLFGLTDLYCVQTEAYKGHLQQVGVSAERIAVTGNMKLDDEPVKMNAVDQAAWKAQLGIRDSDRLLVIGSTHDPEEKILLEVCEALWQKYPALRVLLVPRHPERFDEVAGLLERKGVSFVRYSALEDCRGDEKVILVDAMGVLKKCYQIAEIAIVAGSYTQRIGGHNIIEPCWFGVPVLFGPYMHTQADLVALALESGAGKQVAIEQLEEVMSRLLSHPEELCEMSRAGLQLVQGVRGATEKTWGEIRRMMR